MPEDAQKWGSSKFNEDKFENVVAEEWFFPYGWGLKTSPVVVLWTNGRPCTHESLELSPPYSCMPSNKSYFPAPQNPYKIQKLKQQKCIATVLEASSQKSRFGSAVLSSTQGGSGPAPPFWLLMAACILGLKDASVQSHDCLLPVCLHIFLPLCMSVSVSKFLFFF